MGFKKNNERYYMASVRLGPKGQIVIPKDAEVRKRTHPAEQKSDIFCKGPGYLWHSFLCLLCFLCLRLLKYPAHHGVELVGGVW